MREWKIDIFLNVHSLHVVADAGHRLEDARDRAVTLAFLEVRPTNAEAVGLYERFGFRVIGRRKGYYFDTGEDALVMEARLTPDPSESVAPRRPGA